MRQFTKFLIVLMSVVLLLSVPLSAADPVQGGDSGIYFDGDIFLKKQFIPDTAAGESNLSGKIRLESFATGSTTSSNIPVDIVLVLDQSGSMNDIFTTEYSGNYTPLPYWANWASDLYQYNTGRYANTLRVLVDGVYYPVTTTRTRITYYYLYYIYYTVNGTRHYLANGVYYNDVVAGDFYTFSGTSVSYTRLHALKNAVTTFTNTVNTHANGADGQPYTADDLNHRVAIVGYSSYLSQGGTYYYNTELLTGVEITPAPTTKNPTAGNGVQFDYTGATPTVPYPVGAGLIDPPVDLQSALVSMNTPEGRTGVTNAITALDAEGGTRTDRGMLMAKQILDANPVDPGEVRAQVVVLFTDGAPTYSSNFSLQVADNAIGYAKELKDRGIPVYSVGIFPGADSIIDLPALNNVITVAGEGKVIPYNDSESVKDGSNRFMHYISSNYPAAVTIEDSYTRAAGSDYYLAAQSAAQLNTVFTRIARETLYHLGNKDLNEQSTVLDIVSEFCDIPEGTLASEVKVYTAKLEAVSAAKLAANPLDYTAYTFYPEIEWSSGSASPFVEGSTATFTKPSSSDSINLILRYDVAPYTSVDGSAVLLDYVKAEGYNYNAHFCGEIKDNENSIPNPAGEKLIIEFPVEFDYNSPVDKLDSNTFKTNAFGSGVYPTDPDANEDGAYDGGITPAGLFEFPYGKYYIVYTYTMNNDGTYTSVEKVVKAVAKDATFANINLTQSVPENYLYGGYWTHDTAPQADNQDTNPLNISGTEAGKWVTERFTRDVAGTSVAPVTGNSYNVRCVPDTYLRPGYHITYAEATASQNPLLPHNLYVTTGVDCTAYKYVGFDMRRDDVSSSPRASIVYNVLSGIDTLGSPKNYSIADMFYFEDGSGERLIGSLGVAMITPPDGSCASDAASLTWWDNFKNCIYTPFWVTPDNVKVNGVKERTIDWKTEAELAGKQLDKTDKTDLTFSLRGKFPSVCALDTYNPDNLAAAPVMLTLWDSFALDAPFNGPTEGSENISSGTTGENANTTPAQSYDFSYKLVHSLINRMGQRVLYNTYISTDDSDFVEIGVIVNGRTYAATRAGQAPRLANLKYNYVTGWMGYGVSTVQAYKVMADGTVVYGDTVSVK